jgi:hypothetical protein
MTIDMYLLMQQLCGPGAWQTLAAAGSARCYRAWQAAVAQLMNSVPAAGSTCYLEHIKQAACICTPLHYNLAQYAN